jgi:hypothetical protein
MAGPNRDHHRLFAALAGGSYMNRFDTEQEIRAFYAGMREGVREFAHWKDGKQYVGTTGRTLIDELGTIDHTESVAMVTAQPFACSYCNCQECSRVHDANQDGEL